MKFEALMMEAISLYEHKEIEALLFPRVDRETRFIYSSFPLLCDVIKAGLKVFFAREQFELDPNNPESTERYLNKAIQSESYIRTMIANTTKAKSKLVDKGILPTGTGHGLYGFRWDKASKKRVPIEYEVKIVEKIFAMLADGMSRFKIAEALNNQAIPTKHHGKWHPLTIGRLATNPAYTGLTFYYQTRGSRKTHLVSQDKAKWTVLKNATPAVISQNLFERAQEQLRLQKEARHSMNTRHYLLRGYAYCGHCGSPLVGTCLNKKSLYYHCRGSYPTSTRGAICKARYIRAEILETLVWDKVKAILSNPDTVLAELRKQAEAERAQSDITPLDEEIKAIGHRLKDYPNQEKRLINAIKTGQFTEDYVLDEINRVKSEREADMKQRDELRQAKIHLANLATAEAKLDDFYNSVKQRIEQCGDDDKRLAFEALALKVKASPELVEIAGVIPVDITTMQSSGPLLTIAQTSA
ncbi:MAG: recombinase family protein [Chloroflexi bacterium]|nr:recombinase family protein [Chloroflexota bacterium]